MAFLDFIKNRAGQQQAQQAKSEVSREVSAQRPEQGVSAGKTPGQMPEDVRATARDLGARVTQATANIQADATAMPQAPTDATDNPQPMVQNMMKQDKAAPDLSPTSAQSGIPMKDVEGPGVPPATPSPTQDQSRQTIARPTPSWER